MKELITYMKEIETFSQDMGQDATALHEYLIRLTNYLARSNQLMAEYKRELNIAKKNAYLKVQASMESQGKNLSPMLAKDYVNSICHDAAYCYDSAERCSRLIVHTIDAIRTVISSLKNERMYV